jgi:uncharacterized protein YbbC (DUF1343 family)
MIQFGIDRLLTEKSLQDRLRGKRIGLLAHPASVTAHLVHTMDAIAATPGLRLSCAFGPQHGMRGEKQYNMIESEDYLDPVHRVPVYSLYGKSRRPTPEMLQACDVVMVDLQDLGCRIYTYLTTMVYMMEECAKLGKEVWVLDRPNPAGRKVEGSILKKGNESFVGVGPVIMRHGLTLGEIAGYVNRAFSIGCHLEVVAMQGYDPESKPGYGWPLEERAWVNPSPNAPTLSMARCYSGTVMLEGTNLSEGRGTTRPLEGFGAPGLDGVRLLQEMERLAPQWLDGCLLRPFYFEPTFYKHKEKLCSGIQIHVDHAGYDPVLFSPYRIQALAFKAIRNLHPDYDLFRNFPYEYVFDRLAIDVITGCPTLRTWVEDPAAVPSDLDAFLRKDEELWMKETRDARLY